eukprot:g2484.t1
MISFRYYVSSFLIIFIIYITRSVNGKKPVDNRIGELVEPVRDEQIFTAKDIYSEGFTVCDKRVKKNVESADTRDFLESIRDLSIKTFEYVSPQFESSRFRNRRHIGVFAQEILGVVPDAVSVLPSMQVNLPGEQERIEMTNFHMIDSNRLFWVNLGATQQLIQNFDLMTGLYSNVTDDLGNLTEDLSVVQRRLLKEAELELVNKRKLKEAEVKLAELTIQKERVKGEEERKSLEYKAKQESANVEYNDRLSRERAKIDNKRARERNEELVSLQSDAARKQEEIRLQNEKDLEEMKAEAALKRAELQAEATVKAAEIEGEAKIRQERENEDIAKRMQAEQALHDREKLIAAIKTGFRLLGEGIASFLSSPQQLVTTGLFLGVSGLLLFIGREAAKVLAAEVARRLKRPELLRESSKDNRQFSMINRAVHWTKTTYRHFRGLKEPDPFDGIVLPQDLRTRLRRMAISIGNSRRHGAPMRHFLFYGPPGTGKTMTARQLARKAGLDYAIMSGGDVVPLAEQAVTELHKVMDWARSSKRGLLLFIDEAEAFLGSRNQTLSETLRNAVSAILYHTGTPQKNFMLILATNRPGDLDMAVADRIDEALEYGLPDKPGRINLVNLYYNKYIVKHRKGYSRLDRLRRFFTIGPTAEIEISNDITPKVLEKVADKADKFSGREIDKLMLAVQAVVYGSDRCYLDAKLLLESVDFLIRDQRKKWQLLSKKTVWS